MATNNAINANSTTPLPIVDGGTQVTSVTTAPAATAFAGWDANKNLAANNMISGYATTVSSASPIVLTVASAQLQYITGSTAQTVTMPVTSTLASIASNITQSYTIVNLSSNTTTINSSGGNLIVSLPAGTQAILTCISNSGTTAASWSSDFSLNIAGVASITGTANQVIASASTGAVTLSTPQSIGTGSSPTFAALTLTNPYIAGAGGLHSFQIFISGSAATYTRPANVTSILVEIVGGGGGSGGTATTGATTMAASGGGGGGGYARLWIPSAASTYTYTVGAGGTAATAGNNTGGTGGTTTFSASSLQATGGVGGAGMPAVTATTSNSSGGGTGGIGTNGDVNIQGSAGGCGFVSLLTGFSGFGGASAMGGSANGIASSVGTSTGFIGLQWGAGGGGSIATNNAALVGVVGKGGIIIVWEFC